MEELELYDVDLKRMSQDTCYYEYVLDDSFFKAIDAPEIRKGNLHVRLEVKKGIRDFLLHFYIKGEVTVPCDRCLDDMSVCVDTADPLKVVWGTSFSDEGEWVVVPEDKGVINVAWFVYEFIVLALPVQRIHQAGECNEEMVKSLNKYSCIKDDGFLGQEEEFEEGNEIESIDPRWNGLKKILNNN